MRSLATIQTINKIEPIEGADRIELATILGWHVIVKKGEFNVGDKCVYIEIDSLLPEKPEFEFLREKKFRIKTMKVRGVISQGICFPLFVVGLDEAKYNVGDDVTEILGVTKYDLDDDADLEDKTSTKVNSKLVKFLMRYKFFRKIFSKKKKRGDGFPTEYISKTDETRIQSMPWVLERDCGEYYYSCEKLDGCFEYGSNVTTDIGQIQIGQIVNKKMNINVLSYNEETRQCEFKPITDYHKVKNWRKNLSIAVGTRGKGNRQKYIRCTDNHKILTADGWKEAKDLVVGEIVYHFNRNMSSEMIEILLGCLLGDSSINSNTTNGIYRTVNFNHSVKQEGYFNYKKNLFGRAFIQEKDVISGYGSLIKRGKLATNLSMTKYINEYCVKDNKKYITKEWMNNLTPMSIAFWYMDDGTLKNREDDSLMCRASISTNRYTLQENIMFKDMFLNKFNIECTIGDPNVYKGHTLHFDTKNTEKFCSLIAPYICEDMKYKIPKKYENLKCYLEGFSFNLNDGIIETKILDINEIEKPDNYVYDISVADNENYFVNNILVHNCSGSFLFVKNKFPHNIFGKKYEYIVASRNRIAPQDSSYTKVSEKYNVEEVLKSIAKEYGSSMVAIQGEVIGDKIQGNKYKISGHQLYVFNLIIDGKLKNIHEMHDILDKYNMLIVPLVWEGQLNHTVDEVIEMSKGKSHLAKRNREGLVFRKLSDPRVSFKAINPEFLLEEK